MYNLSYDSVCYKRFKSRFNYLPIDDECWTSANIINLLIDELFHVSDERDGSRKYVKFCGKSLHRLNVYDPPPILQIEKKDLSPTLYKQLIYIKQQDHDAFTDVVTEAIRQLYEVSNTADNYHRFIGKGNVRWVFV